MRVLVLDNYDSFTYNLVQYLGELGSDVEVVRNDHAAVDELLIRGYDRVIVSPGPCTPNEAGISLEAVRRFPVLAAYELCLKCSHLFNLLDARGAISVTERVAVMARIRNMVVGVARAYAAQRQKAGGA